MRIISIINQKGGSGKTTTTVNLAATLAEKNRKILLMDLDPQGSTTSWLDLDHSQKKLYDVFAHNENITKAIKKTDIKNVDAIPSSKWLVGLEKALAHEVGAETILKQQCKKLSPKKYDYLLIDCPPNLGILTVNALCAAQEVIIPVEARVMALNGLVQLLQTIDIIKERLNKQLQISGIVPCRLDTRTKHAKEVVDTLQTNFKGMLFKTAIRENIRLSESPSFTKPINQYDTKCNGTLDYRALAEEVILQEKQ